MERVEFRQCKFLGSDFNGALWRHVLFEEVTGEYCSFSTGDFHSVRFENCSFPNSSFSDCRLKLFHLQDCSLVSCEYLHTSLKGIDLRSCRLEGLRLAGPELIGVIVTSLQAVELSRFLGLVIEDNLSTSPSQK